MCVKMKFYIILILVLILIITFILCLRYSLIIKAIKSRSVFFQELLKLNHFYSPLFLKLKSIYVITHKCNSLAQFRNNNNVEATIKYLCEIIEPDENIWKDKYAKALQNSKVFDTYMQKFKDLQILYWGASYKAIKKKTIFLTEKQYKKWEERYCESFLLNPVRSLTIQFILFYTSPAGRAHYEKEFIFKDNYINDLLFSKIQERQEWKESKQYQRSLMTYSKRYDIMKRDHFQCQLCGRTQADGVKLEVDHIIPVSKGGKTVDENLRTLCNECNRGKSNKL